ncbi:glycosyltransferase family protein [Pedobacter cryophilus]|uniref:Glycosyltransferase family 2 protein n=1 Tax=Pedobacter cryophilus TaxID=2571271 RepID=A0A4U1C5D6_9SPHI|nr:glycosyltransferase family 2 protein [Pedobacter cryophilus]TKC00589.1 glycosyltransferase family 2 protein [Pedobacter cryophilus]
MKVAGFTFIRNAVTNDYPIVEAITSILPLCDEFIIAHGNSSDDTLKLLQSIDSPKIKIIETTWNDEVREGGKTFALETDKAFKAISKDADWAFYIQGDEVIHEKYHAEIKKEMENCLNDKNVEGLLFKYLHFYGSYDYVAVSRRWYRKEIRIVKNLEGISSYRDAQGLRINGRKIKVKEIEAYVYHYGWVKPPQGLNNKVRNFNKFYHEDDWIETNMPKAQSFDYGNADELKKFTGSHPIAIQQRITNTNWEFSVDPTLIKKKLSLRRRFLKLIEEKTGYRPFEYKNYNKIK